jgi:hypothetical protein
MAARNTTLNLVAGTWLQLTDNNVTLITFQNRGQTDIYVAGTTSASAPANRLTAIKYGPGQGERNVSLGDLFPGISAVRVYAVSDSNIEVYVSHAA